jgi:hypothetical protein
MNITQKVLYEYLMEKGEWVSQVEIARELFKVFGNNECCFAPKEYHNTTERTEILRAKQEINENPEFQKIIISGKRGLKIATQDEFDRYRKSEYASIFRRLKRIRTMERKANLHNQIDFDGNAVDSFIEKFAKNY